MNPLVAISAATKGAGEQTPSPKLVKAAQDFEAILLSNWLEKLEASFSGPNDGSDPGRDTLAAMGTQAMASAWAARGGIGVAKLMLQHVTKPEHMAVPAAAAEAAKKEFPAAKVPQEAADRLR